MGPFSSNLWLHRHSEILCGVTLLFFLPRKKQVPGVLQPKAVFLAFYQQNLSGLKDECVRFQYGTKLMARKLKI